MQFVEIAQEESCDILGSFQNIRNGIKQKQVTSSQNKARKYFSLLFYRNTLKNKVSYLVGFFIWFCEEPLTYMEPFHCTKGSMNKPTCKRKARGGT